MSFRRCSQSSCFVRTDLVADIQQELMLATMFVVRGFALLFSLPFWDVWLSFNGASLGGYVASHWAGALYVMTAGCFEEVCVNPTAASRKDKSVSNFGKASQRPERLRPASVPAGRPIRSEPQRGNGCHKPSLLESRTPHMRKRDDQTEWKHGNADCEAFKEQRAAFTYAEHASQRPTTARDRRVWTNGMGSSQTKRRCHERWFVASQGPRAAHINAGQNATLHAGDNDNPGAMRAAQAPETLGGKVLAPSAAATHRAKYRGRAWQRQSCDLVTRHSTQHTLQRGSRKQSTVALQEKPREVARQSRQVHGARLQGVQRANREPKR